MESELKAVLFGVCLELCNGLAFFGSLIWQSHSCMHPSADGSVKVGTGGQEEDQGRLFMEADSAWLKLSSCAPWPAHGRHVCLIFAQKLHLFSQNCFAFWKLI